MEQVSSELLREEKVHGSSDYPIEFYENAIPDSFRNMNVHWHREFEISLIDSGKLRYIIGRQDFEVRKGDILLIGPETLHAAQQINKETARTTTIVFHLNLLGLETGDRCAYKYIQPFYDRQLIPIPVISPEHPDYPELLNCYQNLWKDHASFAGSELLVKSDLYRLMYQIWQITPKEIPEDLSDSSLRNIEKLKPVLTYIHTHYMEPLTIEELASLCGFSPVHFMNIFKQYIKTPCMDYIISYRVMTSAEDLKTTNAPIMKIALDHGFRNVSYFNRKFRELMGCTPSEYRKTNHRQVL